ncbi:hypothetical protein R2325_13975 [Mycobacteroides chelonae]|uniref:hypothetical protein n=1 Tax=Mycobacteroides chelonae TaxID=1774 RepID=UPI002DF6BB56|nr:hypothetical protein [Mycobacteroides chelonae]MEC4873133.1 hypothetical protein [Mycobacteroides chelonae]
MALRSALGPWELGNGLDGLLPCLSGMASTAYGYCPAGVIAVGLAVKVMYLGGLDGAVFVAESAEVLVSVQDVGPELSGLACRSTCPRLTHTRTSVGRLGCHTAVQRWQL